MSGQRGKNVADLGERGGRHLGDRDQCPVGDLRPGASSALIGIDGIAEAKALIDKGASPLCATVIQDADRLAERTVLTLEAMHNGKKVAKRTYLQGQLHPAG